MAEMERRNIESDLTASRTAAAPTIRVRRSDERGYEDFGWADNRMTFSFAEYEDPAWHNFGPLRVMVENYIQPHSGFPPHQHRDVEIVTYVSSGILTHADSFGHRAGITPGEMQHISAGSRGMIHSEENLHDEVEHNYQMWLIPNRAGTQFAYHQLKFAPEERQGRLRLYASQDGRDGSMPMNTDALIYSGLFAPGDSVNHEIERGRGVWIQLVRGSARVGSTALASGDGIGIADASRINIEFHGESEVLLFDVSMNQHLLWK